MSDYIISDVEQSDKVTALIGYLETAIDVTATTSEVATLTEDIDLFIKHLEIFSKLKRDKIFTD